MDCIFCAIIKGEIPSTKVYENDYVYAFKDINPMAPVHIVIVPKIHFANANEVTAENSAYIAKIFEAIPEIAKICGLSNGYRIVNNCGEDGCQSVMHIHFHLIGGKKMPETLA